MKTKTRETPNHTVLSSLLAGRLRHAISFVSGLCLTGLMPLTAIEPTFAAEKVTLTYSFFTRSVSVESLRTYANTGEISEELAPYFNRLNEAERSQFRTVLQTTRDISPVELSGFLYSSIGGNILNSLGLIIRTQGGQNGATGLRGALVLAAAEPGSFSAIDVLEKFPTRTVRIGSHRIFEAINSFTALSADTRQALAAIKQQADANSRVGDANPVIDLAQRGPYGVSVETFTIIDASRDRTLPVDLYLPVSSSSTQVPSPSPLVVASHGLAGDREGFQVIGEHLASYGYVLAAVDHPGSDINQLEALLKGEARKITQPTEFADRPRDISFLIDELARLSGGDGPLSGRVATDKVGAIGHSFGGTTVLSLAGAQLDLETLQANCASPDIVFNEADPSMLLQCVALEAPEQFSADLRDERIQSVMAMNPVTSSLFGQGGFSQLSVPSLLVAGSADPIAPAILEQIRPFIWLNEAKPINSKIPGSEHYLALIEGGSHLFEAFDLDDDNFAFINALVSPDISLSDRYFKAISLGFMQTTLTNNAEYDDVLTGRSIVQMGQQPLPLYVISTLTEDMLVPDTMATRDSINKSLPKID